MAQTTPSVIQATFMCVACRMSSPLSLLLLLYVLYVLLMLVVVGGRGREGRGCCVVVDGGGVGKSDELAVIGPCALSYTA